MNIMRILKSVAIAAIVMFNAAIAGSQVNLAPGGNYTQNFDGLGTTSIGTYSNNITLVGWYVTSTGLPINTGSTNTNSCYNFGIAGTNALTDRALGAISTGTSHRFGLRILNNGATDITSLNISFTGEQWRSFNAGTLTFDYQVGTTVTSITAGTFTAFTTLNFASLQTSGGAPLDGNLPANRSAVSGTLTVTIPAGSEIMLRWNRVGTSSPGLAIDDFSISAVGVSAFVTTQDGPWTTGATWVGGVAPGAGDNVVINHNVTSGAVTRNAGTTTTIGTAGTLRMSGTYTNNGTTTVNGIFQLDNGGFASGNNFTYGAAGTLNFNTTGAYGVDNTHAYWPTTSGPFNVNVLQGGMTLNGGAARTVAGTFTTAAGITLNAALTCNGTCQINANGFFSNSPTYGATSTLVYNNAGAYGSFNEWTGGAINTVAVGVGIPNNVTLQGNTNLTLAGGRGLAGNLVVETGATLTLNGTAGDLYSRGNLTFNGTGALNGNNRAIFFVLNGTQTITSAAALTIPYMVYQPSTGSTTVTLGTGTNLTVSAPNTGNAISFNSINDVLFINGNTLTVGTTGLASTISGVGRFRGSSTSTMTVLGTGNIGTIDFANFTPHLANFNFNRTSGGAATISTASLTLNITAMTIDSGDLILGNSTTVTTLALNNGTVTIGSNNLTFGTVTTTGTFSSTTMIRTNGTGVVIRSIPTTATLSNPYLYPIGTGTTYTPASYNFTSNGLTRTLAVRVVPTTNPNMGTVADRIDNRYWETYTNALNTYSYTASYTYAPGDQVGSAALTKLNRWNGTAWVIDQASTNVSNTLTSSTLNETSGVFGNSTTPSQWVGRQGFLPNNIGIASVSVPTPLCAGSVPVSVTINNYGTNTITSATVTLTIGGIPQAPVNLTGLNIAPITGSQTVVLGNYTFSTSATTVALSAATSLPNGFVDDNPLDDSGTGTAPATGLSGTYTVGTAGNYTSLTAAVNDANTRGICGPVVFSLTNTSYTTGETFPITINQLAGSSAVNTLTIKPATGVTATISGSAATNLILLNGADYIIIDGSNAVSGTTKDLTIVNASANGAAIKYEFDATNNIVRNTILQSANVNNVNGTVVFGNATTTGNDFNSIINCDLGDGAATPWNAIYSATGSSTIKNNNITIDNCNIFNFFRPTGGSTICGIQLATGNGQWTITNNKFYQTSARVFTGAANVSAIYLTDSNVASDGYVITGNTIGFANSAGTGVWSQSGSSNQFIAINLVGPTLGNLSVIENNIISGISVSTSNSGTGTLSPFIGIITRSGRWNIGTTLGNRIGSLDGSSSVTYTSSSTSTTDATMIYNFSSDDTSISNNKIGSITATNSSSTGAIVFAGIRINTTSARTANISNNIIGGASGAININTTNSTAARAMGIWSETAINTISGNSVSNINLISANTGTTTNSSAVGILLNATSSAGHTISNNTIHSIQNTIATGNVTVAGIVYNGFTGTNTIEKNFVHSLSVTSPTGIINGIDFLSANPYIVKNNFIRLGIDAAGNSISNANNIVGLRKSGAGNQEFYFNSVYIGGLVTPTTATNTAAFQRAATGTTILRSNIFVNARSNATSGGGHYALQLNNTTNLTVNNNVYLYSGTGGAFALNNATPVANYSAAWLASDVSSIVGNPVFVNATGNASTVDLHITPAASSVAESAGAEITGITDDYDALNTRPAGGYPLGGQVNGGGTAPDAGADEGDFAPGGDNLAPVFTYTPITSPLCDLGNISISNVTITDATGLPSSPTLATSTLRPRIYYRKNAGTWFSNGGTYVSGTATNSVWDFTINVTDMGGVTGGDAVSYYIIAQDDASPINIASVPSTGLVATDVNTVSTHPTTPNVYSVVTPLVGTYTVGAAGNYATLADAINAYNTTCIGGPVVFSLIDNTYTVSSTLTINSNIYQSSTNTLTIKPAPGVSPTITGSLPSPIISLVQADYVTIDGSNGFVANSVCPLQTASRDLTIINNSLSGAAVIWLSSGGSVNQGATNNTIKNCIISGSTSSNTLIALGAGSTTIGANSLGLDNDNNRYENNLVRSATIGIFSQGAGSTNENTGTVIQLNEMTDSGASAIGRMGIYIGYEDGAVIRANKISNIGGVTSTLIGIAAGIQTISTTADAGNGVVNAQITDNVINNITASATAVSGIAVGSSTETSATSITNNMIGGVLYTGTTSSQIGSNIYVANKAGNTFNIDNNTIHMFGSVTSVESKNHGVTVSTSSNIAGVVNVRNNIFSNTVNNTNGKTTCIAVGFGGTPPFSALNFNFNRFYLNGTNTFIGGYSGLTSGGLLTSATLPAWQSAISEDANSTVGLVTFVSNTDLHIDVNVGTNFLLDGTATNLSLASDIDCDIRTNPYDVGADEFIVPNCDLVDAGSITSAAAFVCGSATTTISSTGYTLPYTGITYQWEYSADGSTGWSPISGATNPDLLTIPVLTADGYFRLSITCSFSTNTDVSNVIMIDYRAIPTASASSNGPICAGQTLNLTGSTDIGTSFAWSGPNSFVSTDQNPSISSATVAATGTYTFVATANGCSSTQASVSVLVNATPAAVVVTPASASICDGASQVLTTSGGVTTTSTTVSSGTINQAIPDNSAAGTTNTITVSGIPAGATVTGMAVTLNITHSFPGDIVMNLRAPNNNVLNLINSNADGGDNFTNTVISSAGVNQLSTSASPYTGTFAATAANGVSAATGQTSNVTVWTSLYGTANGNYVLSLRDDLGLDTGTLDNWSITVFYTEPASYVWSPSTGLSATTGATVTASPTSNQTYTATVTNAAGCSNAGTTNITINPRPTGSISGTATICASSPTNLTLTVTGTGTISGTLSTGQTFSGTAPTIVVSVSPSSNTTYTIATLVDANCSANAGDLSGSAVITTQPNETFYQDLDGDGFGNQSVTITTCVQPVGYVPAPVGDLNFDGQPDFDCNDTNEDVNPGADEICSPEDDNCDGFINEGYATITYYQDLDGDTFGNPAVFVTTCALPPLGYVLNNTDCNDNSAAARPNATEICDGIDNDCDTQIDEGCGGPINDNRFTALIVFPNNFGQCSNNTGTLLGATVSAEAQSTCVTGQDVWYYFTATSNGVSIIVNSSVNNILVELQTDAGVLMDVENAQSGIGNERMNFSGLIPGNTYYLAIRNFNSAQGVGGPFSFCVQRLFGSSCDLATPSPSLCAAFKATFTNANQYIYHFGSTVVNGPYAATVAGSGNTLLPLASVPGLTYGMTVTVSVDAVYALPNGLGVMENITVPGLSSCTFTTAPQPNIYVRAIDSCPNAKSLNAIIRAEPNICGQIIDYEWEFTEVLPNPGLPVTAFRGAADRFWRISWIPGVVPGGQYSVRIRPIFAGNVPGAWSTTPSCIRVIGAAQSVKEPIVVNQQYTERSLVTEGMDMDFSIFPNPTNGDAVTIVGTSTIEGPYQIRITDALGKIVFTDKIYREQGAFNHVIVFEQRLGAGLYMIEWITPDNLKTTEKLVVQN